MWIRRLVSKITSRLEKLDDFITFKNIKPNHIFEVNIDEIKFKMCFGSYSLDGYKAQRVKGIYEKETSSIIRTIISPGDKVLELGGCYGYFTLLMSHCVGEKGEVISIEGTPAHFHVLKKNLEINDCINVKAFNVFLTNRVSDVFFDEKDSNVYNAIERINSKSKKRSKNSSKVKVVDLNSFLK